ncbi:MAG TPA: ABC transporter permease [Thermomicrobiales bacterium]|nr:ABC transporter permease [Thermomicrobiales bacterium]
MNLKYVVQRIGLFFVVVWGAATLNFFLPRLAPGDPVRSRLFAMMTQGGFQQSGVEEMVKAYQAKFGLDQPLWKQYLNYLWDTVHFDFGYSLSFYPNRALDLIMRALPWTIGLLTVTTILSFAIGTILGALIAWPKSPKILEWFLAPMLTLAAIPYYLLALILVYVFAFSLKWFPLSGGYQAGTLPQWSWAFAWDVIKHSILPALSIILAAIGSWAIGIRAMMVTTSGEDYMTFAEARGLKDKTIFSRYALRNAMLPQVTALALSLGHVVSGALIVEVVFTYPGVGSLLYNAIQTADYFIIYGVVFMVILTIALATLIVDLMYPLLDPRIRV